MSLPFSDPPTVSSLADAKNSLQATRSSIFALTTKIEDAEATLARVVQESQCFINELQEQRMILEEQALHTMAYLSPIRRLPMELLRDIFMWCFEDHPCCAWVLAAVSSSWRRLVLKMPKIWSKIRLVTTQHASADTIRLWLERSGSVVPLDIEIFLRVANKGSILDSPSSRRRRRSLSPTPSPPPWAMSFAHNNNTPGIATHYVIPHPPISPAGVAILPPVQTPIVLPPSPGGPHDTWLLPHQHQHQHHHTSSERQGPNTSRSSLHWGHIAIYYLAEQMHRWERFIFRFDKQFTSMGALKSISGDAPLLKEFEVSSAEAAYYPEWQWLPNASPSATLVLPQLHTLTLQYTPFKWSSPMLRANLHTLNLRALPTSHLPLDRIMYIIANNPSLVSLTLHFQGVLPAILPLTSTTLHSVKTFHIGGHYILSQLVDSLVLPSLDNLTLDIEARDPIEETISNLLARSNNPILKHLSVAYGSSSSTSSSSSFYYGPSGIVISWTTLLTELGDLESLYIGGTPLEPLLAALGRPDEDDGGGGGGGGGGNGGSGSGGSVWACPRLEALGMRNCHAHSEGVAKLVQMVEARNPASSGGGGGGFGQMGGVTPARLKTLELYDCATLGQDVVQWLKSRIEEVVCTEPEY